MRGPPDSLQAASWAIARQDLRRLSRRHVILAFLMGVRRAEQDVGRSDLMDPRAQEFAAQFPYRSINSLAVWGDDQVRRVIVEGIRDGKGTAAIAQNLATALAAHRGTVEVIARTETNRAANWGRFSGWRTSGLVREKEFIATLDDRVAPDHLEAHGEVVPLDEVFTRGAAAGFLMPPLRPNCRCTAAPVSRYTEKGRSRDQVDEDVEAAEEHRRTLDMGQVAAITGVRRAEDIAAKAWLAEWARITRRMVRLIEEHPVD